MALKKVKGNFERMFDKNLTDLVRGIRNNKDNEAKYIAQCMEEIKQELRQDNINVKANAVAKLTYLQMCGYDISWAGFNMIEVMSSNRFTCKRIGYLAASQCFHPDSELLMLTTNMIRKDLSSTNQYDAGVALSGLSCFISTDLSRDLANDIMTLMSSTRPYLRMKAVLMMYKVFLRYPEALRPAFPKLKEKLEDPDPGVQSAAVNVICELARKNPKNYLSLAPIFFKLMTTSTNNWMLIKIIKLFGALTPLEPRLGKKLIEPLTNLIHSTSAMSLLYECINTVIAVLISISSGMPNHSASIQLCVQKLRILIEDSDQNLKYLGLLAMSKILKTHPKSVQTHKDLILACLDDKDESIRLRALDLLYGMVSKKNLMEIVRRLLGHMERAEGSAYRDELLFKVIEICSQGSYQYVTNFEWYLTVLVELIQLESGSKHGKVIATQLLDVAIRVQAVRTFAVNEMSGLLTSYPISTQNSTMHEVLYAAAWIVGEFGSHLDNPEQTLNTLLQPRQLPGHIQAVYVQNATKLFANLIHDCLEEDNLADIRKHCDKLLQGLPIYQSSGDIEVQERANSAFMMVQILKDTLPGGNSDILTDIATSVEESEVLGKPSIPIEVAELIREIKELFVGDLNPVATKAQRKVQLPDGLDLDEWINTPPTVSSESSDEEKFSLFVQNSDDREQNGEHRGYKKSEQTQEELDKIREARIQEQINNPNYLKPAKKKDSSANEYQNATENYDEIPIAEIALEIPLQIHSTKRSDKYLLDQQKSNKSSGGSKKAGGKKSKRHKKSRKHNYTESDSDSDDPKPLHVVNTVVELPEGAIMSDAEEKTVEDPNDPHLALNIDLDVSLETERMARQAKTSAVRSSYILTSRSEQPASAAALAANNGTQSKQSSVQNEDTTKSSHRKKEKKKSKDKDRERRHRRSGREHDEDQLVANSRLPTGKTSSHSSIGSRTAAAERQATNLLEPETQPVTKKSSHKKKHLEGDNNHAEMVAEGSSKQTDKTHKKKKSKKEKTSKSEKSSSSKMSGYEEAIGISTPSKEVI
ncbi:AP-3 complex subunit delta isoform X1 [Toxorhynchites rutilus septentrionalis]|uniref:AP-3 complex subunit delta isoform X1 n=1 Tax=Toxorhynchites rutilus septentrionalis TaxID=329112 RepID=UPI002478FDBE|nr:AP-3 complex subunit delta isoform X1 [Toxorhynchites rutilus septentrionalis]XP_055641321.1 AP-3 complex subunit delta isoform X1 [Toxorhynchites rutilus septentrionalis]XP_055641328.1 AP-3 complex subunit delta isoform X1 [Toxorhynchites rutilus septentrionalis]